METLEKTLSQLIEEYGIKCKAVEDWNDNAPENFASMRNARHYRVTLSFENRTMSLWYYCGQLASEPTAYDVVYSLLSDSYYSEMTLDDMIGEIGIEIKSVADFRNWEKCHKLLVKQNRSFKRLIGNDEIIKRLGESEGI